jgi:zinc protease
MFTRTRLLSALPLVVTLAFTSPAWAQAQPQPTVQAPAINPADTLPFDPAVTTGTLPNGLRYYIRHNTRPEKRVMLQLAVKAGSVDETDPQQGLAHFLEHMAFNGGRHFKPGELISTFESTGARMGPHLNAYTSFDETVYMFQLPTDQDAIVRKGVQALSDFAGGMTLDPKEIDKERGVVIEEWRGGLGAGSRLRDQQIPVLYHKSKYAERLPIGKPEILKTFTPDQLRAFYTKWYRPDRMAVVIVGDVDEKQMLGMVREEFGSIPKPSTPAPDRVYEVPLHTDLLVKVATDPEATQSSVSLVRKRPRGEQDRVIDYRRDLLVHRLVIQMLNDRFDELSRKPEAQFLDAGAYESGLSPTTQTFTLAASVQEGKIVAGLSALAVESKRVKQFGFGPGETDRAKKSMLAGYQRAYAERDKTESGSYAREYVSHFLEGEPSPGIEYEYKLAQALVPQITPPEIADAVRSMFADESRVILAVTPEKAGVQAPAEVQLRGALTSAESVAVTAWSDAASAKPLMARVPDPGVVKDRKEIPDLGVTVVRFGNGVEAWLKPTDFKNDQVLFTLAGPGGTSLAPPEQFYEATLAAALVNFSGAGGHSQIELQKLLAGKLVGAAPFISLSTQGISGSSSPADLETALQLVNLNVTAPGDDPEAFALILKQLRSAYENRDRSPEILFREKVGDVNTGHHYTARPLTLDRIDKLDRAAMTAFYRSRFANAADFTFYMVGAFKVEDAIPLVARYVGSLPSTEKPTSGYKDVGLTFPEKVEKASVMKGTEPKALAVLSFFADPPLDESERTRVEAATDVLEIALRDVLREELGETYSISVGLQQPLPQRGDGRIGISFGAAPENLDAMVERILQEVRRMQQAGPPADLVARAKEAARREYETSLKQNGYWLSAFQSAKLLGRDPSLILSRPQRIEAITPTNVQEMFKKYFPMDRYTLVMLLPEKK